jgi:hypothetical protein
MRNPGFGILAGPAGGKGRAALSVVLLVLVLNTGIWGVSAVVPPGAPDIVEPSPTQVSFTQPAPAPGSFVTGNPFPVPLPAWTVIGVVMIGAAVAALVLLRRRNEYVPRARRLRK